MQINPVLNPVIFVPFYNIFMGVGCSGLVLGFLPFSQRVMGSSITITTAIATLDKLFTPTVFEEGNRKLPRSSNPMVG